MVKSECLLSAMSGFLRKVILTEKLFGVCCSVIKAAPKLARLLFPFIRVHMPDLFNYMMNTERFVNLPALRAVFLAVYGALGLTTFKIFVAAHTTSMAFI